MTEIALEIVAPLIDSGRREIPDKNGHGINSEKIGC